ncbi:guanylate-binding protein 1 [Lingula anatina]|uniref:Guanylate-binding protein 1 n=1 Tax=Lingula anatina TaxID=7574 RepID=A0A1S3ITZ2_LINAN|nr:guanylate-binding protein 1 [Lingula anatina]|eukprot:XP_013401004.1 guanylate-binding protein 1 [Lingula anatina]
MDKPVPLIIQGDNGHKFTINEEAKLCLQNIDKPMSVVAIVGKYRTGKSYLMNRLYGKNSGFDLGSTVQSKTKGIWIWARPHPRDSNRCLLLIDTEGLYDVEKGDSTYDIQLFTLAVLLCNCFVYNSQGTIDADAINKLHLVSELTEHIKIQAGGAEEETGESFSKFFPQFFWVVRDFTLELNIEGKPCTPDEYLEHALKMKKGHGKAVQDYNAPRECIRAFFPHRKCFVLKKPVDDDVLLQKLDQAREEDIKPEFLKDANRFCETVWTGVEAFRVKGNAINGSRYLTLAETYVEAINSGAVPCIGTAVETMMQVECQRALDESVRSYSIIMEREALPNMPLSLKELSSLHEQANGAALRVYQNIAVFDAEGNFQRKLQEALLSVYTQFVEQNKEVSRDKCRQVLHNAYANIAKKVQGGHYTGAGGYGKYQADYQKIKEIYANTQRKGPCADEELARFNEAKKNEGKAILEADKKLSEKEKDLARAQEEAEQQALQAESLKQKQQQLQQELADKEASNLAMIQQVQAEFDQKIRASQEMHEADMRAKQEEHQRLLQEGLDRQAEQYKEMLADMQKNHNQLQQQHQEQTQQLQETMDRQEKLIQEIRANNRRSGGSCTIL